MSYFGHYYLGYPRYLYYMSLCYRKWDNHYLSNCRSSGVLICALLVYILDQFNNIGLLGVSCIIIGILIKGYVKTGPKFHSNMAITIASGIGCLVGSYLVIDRIAIEFVDPNLCYIIKSCDRTFIYTIYI